MFHIKRTPGLSPSAFVNIIDEIKSFNKRNHCDTIKPLKVELSGDGARINRIPNFVTISLTYPDENNVCNQQLCDKMWRVKRICVFEHSALTNFNCACPAIQRGQGSGFLSEGPSTHCLYERAAEVLARLRGCESSLLA